MGHVKITLEKAMNNAGINNRTLAEKLGLTEVHISRLKHGNVKALRLDTLYSLCVALDCTPADLLEIVEED